MGFFFMVSGVLNCTVSRTDVALIGPELGTVTVVVAIN